jgi:hypothetical protein
MKIKLERERKNAFSAMKSLSDETRLGWLSRTV